MPGVILTLEKKSPLDGRNQLLWTAAIVRIIRFSATRQCDSCCVVKIIVPDRVEPIAAGPRRAGYLGTLRFILATNTIDRFPAARRAACVIDARICSGELSNICC